tara:strand:- start:6304 stop:6873 length:570 start_codon:yes stop_codon:yes gene_type:complete
MLKLVSELILQRQFKFESGLIELYGVPLTLLPLSSLVKEQKLLEEKGMENAVYVANKLTGVEWNKNMVKKFKTKTHKQIVDEGNKVMSIAGWGEFKVIKQDVVNKEFMWRIYGSTFAKQYGSSDHAVCNAVRGLFTGAAVFLLGKDKIELDGVETKCLAIGSEYCEFVIKERKKFKSGNPIVERQLKKL